MNTKRSQTSVVLLTKLKTKPENPYGYYPQIHRMFQEKSATLQ
jgi:hypothetical protein